MSVLNVALLSTLFRHQMSGPYRENNQKWVEKYRQLYLAAKKCTSLFFKILSHLNFHAEPICQFAKMVTC